MERTLDLAELALELTATPELCCSRIAAREVTSCTGSIGLPMRGAFPDAAGNSTVSA
jgi:hypothetical protein